MGYKLKIISKLNKILLCALALIYNENKETLESIYKYLKLNYNFYPKLFAVDFGRAGYVSIKNIFPKTRIYPCYFHLIRRLIIHIKNLKSNNKILKRASKDLLFNMKILLFIDPDEIDGFFKKIKNKYHNGNAKFFTYFEKTYLNNNPFKDRQWNYNNFISNEEDSRKYFFTNNVSESLNRTLNSFYNISKKNFNNFQQCIKKIILLYENHQDYIAKDISITRVLSWYCKYNKINELMTYKDKDKIIKLYKQNFNYILNSDGINDINSSDENNTENMELSSSNISSNFFQ